MTDKQLNTSTYEDRKLTVGQVQSPNIFTCRSLRSGQLDSDMHVCESLLSGFSLKAFLHATRVEANRFACAYVKVNVNLCAF